LINALNETARVETSLTRGFYVQFDMQQPANTSPATYTSCGIVVSSSSTLSQSGEYGVFVEMGTAEEEIQYNGIVYAKNGVVVSGSNAGTYSTSSRTVRVEFYGTTGNGDSNDIVVKLSGSEVYRVNNESAHTEFNYLWFRMSSTPDGSSTDVYIDNVTVGSL
jgi:hypothetical protein